MQHSAIIILRALLQGRIGTIDGIKYCLMENNALGAEYAVIRDNEVEKCFLDTDMSFAGFINMCSNVSTENAAIITCETALNNMRKNR